MKGRDIGQFVMDFISHLRNLLIVQSTSNPESILDVTKEHVEILKKQAKEVDGVSLLRWIRIFSELSNELKYTDQKRILLEVNIIKICQPIMDESRDALLDRIKLLEQKLSQGLMVATKEEVKPELKALTETKPQVVKPKAVSKDIKKGVDLWNDIKLGFDPMLQALLTDTKAGYLEDDIYYIVFKDSVIIDAIKKNHGNAIIEKIEETLKKEVNVKFISIAEYEKKYKEIYGNVKESSEETDHIEKVIQFFQDQNIHLEVW